MHFCPYTEEEHEGRMQDCATCDRLTKALLAAHVCGAHDGKPGAKPRQPDMTGAERPMGVLALVKER